MCYSETESIWTRSHTALVETAQGKGLQLLVEVMKHLKLCVCVIEGICALLTAEVLAVNSQDKKPGVHIKSWPRAMEECLEVWLHW